MNKRQNQRADQMGRIIQFVLDHTITPAIPRATTLLTELSTLHERMRDFGSEQEGGGNIFRSGSAQRRALRDEILSAVSEISGTARALDPAEHPGIRDLFRLSDADKSYQRLLNAAASFIEHMATPAVKTLFTDRGFEPDFDTTLTARLIAFAAATGTKYQGRQTQKAGTAGLEALSRRAVIVIRELSAIVMKFLRRTNPLLVPVWQAAARAHIPAVTTPKAETVGQNPAPAISTSEPPPTAAMQSITTAEVISAPPSLRRNPIGTIGLPLATPTLPKPPKAQTNPWMLNVGSWTLDVDRAKVDAATTCNPVPRLNGPSAPSSTRSASSSRLYISPPPSH